METARTNVIVSLHLCRSSQRAPRLLNLWSPSSRWLCRPNNSFFFRFESRWEHNTLQTCVRRHPRVGYLWSLGKCFHRRHPSNTRQVHFTPLKQPRDCCPVAALRVFSLFSRVLLLFPSKQQGAEEEAQVKLI